MSVGEAERWKQRETTQRGLAPHGELAVSDRRGRRGVVLADAATTTTTATGGATSEPAAPGTRESRDDRCAGHDRCAGSHWCPRHTGAPPPPRRHRGRRRHAPIGVVGSTNDLIVMAEHRGEARPGRCRRLETSSPTTPTSTSAPARPRRGDRDQGGGPVRDPAEGRHPVPTRSRPADDVIYSFERRSTRDLGLVAGAGRALDPSGSTKVDDSHGGGGTEAGRGHVHQRSRRVHRHHRRRRLRPIRRRRQHRDRDRRRTCWRASRPAPRVST